MSRSILTTERVNSGFQKLFTDQGSGANLDLTMFKPADLSNQQLYYLGCVAIQGYPDQPGGVYYVKPLGNVDDLLASPIGFERVWQDHGSGADYDMGIWRPIAPQGFVALGCVAVANYNEPKVSDFPGLMCVSTDQVEQTSSSDLIWNDQGSGADQNVSLWAIKNNKGQTAGYFDGTPNYDKPTLANQLKSI